MAKIFITGSNGIIGTVIRNQVTEFTYTCFDLPENDVRDIVKLKAAMAGNDVVIHLAWNNKIENWLSGTIDPDNSLMTYNVYKAAKEANIPRVIMASSIHANDLSVWNGPVLLSPYDIPSPDSPYGASKVFMESLGRYWAKHGLEVVCIRFMGLNANNQPSMTTKENPLAKEKWFSHWDCGNLIRAIVSVSAIPENFAIVYGVSNNTGRPVDISNPFGWTPKDNFSLSK
ncbi:MAG: NAD-dependent epimerase/dehydratase [Parcubacteria group bacterium GW2011_GWA2_47_16]|nr:MAG: NAD-dependent epimerase/dehydratase [Parcubacteria group bacterium GW2011_GWA2_47_16]